MSSNTFPLNSTGSTDEYDTDDHSPSSSSTAEEEEETAGRFSRATTTRGRRRAPNARGRDPPSEVSGGGCGGNEVSKGANGRQLRTTPHSTASTALLNRNARGSGNLNNDGEGSVKSSKKIRGKNNPPPPKNPARVLRSSGRRGVRGRPNSEKDQLSGSGDDDDDDDDGDDDADDDSDTDDDPFANLSRFQCNKRRKLPSGNSSASLSSDDDGDSDRDDSDCSSSYSSSDGYTAKNKNAHRSFSSAKATKKTESFIKSSSANRKPACSSNSNSDGSVSSVELVGPAPRKKPLRITRTSSKTQTVAASKISTGKPSSNALVEKNSTVDKRKSTDSGPIQLLSDDEDIICGTFRRSPGKQTPSAISAVAAATTAQKKKGNEHDPLVRAESQAALEKGRKARDRLKAAQQYKAKEVGLPPPSPPPTASLYQTSSHYAAPVKQAATAVKQAATAAKQPVATTVCYTGPTIQLTLQYSHPTTNKNSKSNIKIKMDQPLQHIMDTQLNVGNSILRITNVTFDGEKINMTKSPSFYDMEDSDLVDAVVMVVQA